MMPSDQKNAEEPSVQMKTRGAITMSQNNHSCQDKNGHKDSKPIDQG